MSGEPPRTPASSAAPGGGSSAPGGETGFALGDSAGEAGAAPASPGDAAVEAVRDGSRRGRAAGIDEILSVLSGQGFDVHASAFCTRVEEALSAHRGIRSFTGLGGGLLYHDPSLLSATFARIQDRKASPLLLMAEEIRQNSRDYPRPLPVELFEAPPFSLTPDAIGDVLRAMAQNPEYADIACAVASGGAVYLYSTRFLEPAYAEFLADHAQGLALNP